MTLHRSLAVIFLVPWALAIGCSVRRDDPASEPLGSTEDPLGYAGVGALGSHGTGLLAQKGIVSQNSLSPGILGDATYVDQLRALGTAALTAEAIEGVGAYDARFLTLMEYTVHCALPLDASVKVKSPEDGRPIELKGNIGLAPDWGAGSLDAAGQGWVTACLLAHANNYGERVDILLVGDHPALERPIAHSDMTVQEAAFYGNLFTPSNGKFLFSCIGADVYGCNFDGRLSDDLRRRVCGSSTGCGFEVNGSCSTPATTEPDACVTAPGDTEVFEHCYATPGSPPTSTPFAEVITVHLQPADFRDAHPGCTKPAFPGPAAPCSHGLCDAGVALAPSCDRCTDSICEVDPYCCDVAWDAICVSEVASICRCLEGLPRSSCDACADLVDDQPRHSYCARGWDALCIRELPEVGCGSCP